MPRRAPHEPTAPSDGPRPRRMTEIAIQRAGRTSAWASSPTRRVCIGCKACEVACKQWNDLPADGGELRKGGSYDNTGELGATDLAPRALRRAADATASIDRTRVRTDRSAAVPAQLGVHVRRLQALHERRLPGRLPDRRADPHRVRHRRACSPTSATAAATASRRARSASSTATTTTAAPPSARSATTASRTGSSRPAPRPARPTRSSSAPTTSWSTVAERRVAALHERGVEDAYLYGARRPPRRAGRRARRVLPADRAARALRRCRPQADSPIQENVVPATLAAVGAGLLAAAGVAAAFAAGVGRRGATPARRRVALATSDGAEPPEPRRRESSRRARHDAGVGTRGARRGSAGADGVGAAHAASGGDARWSYLYRRRHGLRVRARRRRGGREARRRARARRAARAHPGPDDASRRCGRGRCPLYFWFGGMASGVVVRRAGLRPRRRPPLGADRAHGGAGRARPVAAAADPRPRAARALPATCCAIFKPRSPMSMGAWCLTAFGGLAAGAVGADLLGRAGRLRARSARPNALLGGYLGSYTGVLLASTAVPLWARSPAVPRPDLRLHRRPPPAPRRCRLVLVGRRRCRPATRRARALGRVETGAMAAELVLSDRSTSAGSASSPTRARARAAPGAASRPPSGSCAPGWRCGCARRRGGPRRAPRRERAATWPPGWRSATPGSARAARRPATTTSWRRWRANAAGVA